MTLPDLVNPGDRRHGVVLLAAQLAQTLGTELRDHPRPGRPAHLHVTERVWGASPETAARRIAALARDSPLTVTLHDVPQRSDGPGGLTRRAAAYRWIADAARGVAVSSWHEARLLAEHVGTEPDAVIPLPVERALALPRPSRAAHEVGVLGYVYPGKGHAEVIDAVAALGRGAPAVVALGAVAAGHGELAAGLQRRARRAGVRFTVTGWLSDAELQARCRVVRAGVAAHRHVSASGSIGSWITAGRRPLVVASDYAREVDALRPGTLLLADDLPAALATALADPDRTWLDPDADAGPGLADTAAAYARWWARA